MTYTNAQKLAAVLTEWLTPAVSSIATDKLCQLPMMQNLQATIIQSGLVGANYRIVTDLQPFASTGMASIIRPVLEQQLGRIPDAAIPSIAKGVVNAAAEQDSYSVLDGFLTFEQADIVELKELIEKNLPVSEQADYEVIH